MPGRSYQSSTGYRYGFNGQEKDGETYGDGNEYDFGARIYDPRIGRWLSRDPYSFAYPNLSPYVFVDNNPIAYKDLDGNVIVDDLGQKVQIKISKDKVSGRYIATYTFADNTDQATIDDFINNTGKLIDAMIQTPTGRKVLRKAIRSMTKIHYNVTDEVIVGESSSGKVGIAYGNTVNGFDEMAGGGWQNNTAQITISLGTFRFGKTIDPNTGKGDVEQLPGGSSGIYRDFQYSGKAKIYRGSEEEFLNAVGVHETDHALSDLNTLLNNIGKFVDRFLNPLPGRGKQYYDTIEKHPYEIEEKTNKEYNEQNPTEYENNPVRQLD